MEDNDPYSEDNTKRWTEYTEGMIKKPLPDNEYQHASQILSSETEEFMWTSNHEFSRIVDEALQLANISDDKYMNLEQIHAGSLITLYEMARNEKQLRPFFLVQLHRWRSGILLTKAKDGTERKHQAQVANKYTPRGEMRGFGSEMGYDMAEPEQNNPIKSFLGSIMPKKRER